VRTEILLFLSLVIL